ncbi:serine palmitoyltransferase component [Mycoemilia scoparia]|uniref:serine C-palmitoyltransferase n=1 Tax=Mycoemilia scoparia TaxID=417184 RepID=A0A9W8A038_9FUNG|nr:serine palmitoyltransferase component [Mycoemilia scoparia]
MGKGKRATPPIRTTEEIVLGPQHQNQLDLPKTSASHSGPANDTLEAKLLMVRHTKPNSPEKPSSVVDRRRQVSIEPEEGTYQAKTPSHLGSQEESGELDQVPTLILVTTYFSYFILIACAHIRDFFGKIFYPNEFRHLKEVNGYAPMVSDFESLWSRRLYSRISDCFNRPITGVAGGYVTLLDRVSLDHNRSFKLTGTTTRALNLASYNYLGFAQSKGPCADAVERGIKESGITASSPRIEVGQSRVLLETEELVARFVGTEACMIVSMGYATNSLTIPSLAGKGSLIISDELNHSSIVSGARLSGATISVFKHNSVADLEKVLRKHISQGQPRTHRPWKKILVIVEGLYSMEGQFCNLPGILALKERYKFYLFVDEAHSIGAIGPRGRGVCDHFGIDPREIDILMGTFTKSFGAAGGYICANKDIVDHLKLNAFSSVYAETMSVPVLRQVWSSMRIIMGEDREHALEGQERLDQLAINSRYFMTRLREMGFMVLGDPGSPVIPILLCNPSKIPAFSHEALKRNIAVVVVSYPATPIITGRVRICLSSSHSLEDLEYALEQISEIGDLLMLKVRPPTINAISDGGSASSESHHHHHQMKKIL